MQCQFCSKECKNKNSLSQHQVRCIDNPNRKIPKPSFGMLGKKGSNQFIKARDLGVAIPEVSDDTKAKISAASKQQVWSAERKERHSKTMREVAKNNPHVYNASNRGRVRQIIIDGMKFHGQWEADFYQWCKEKYHVIRNEEAFPYFWRGERSYFPDFFIEELNLYVEVKGYKTDRDEAKWSQFPHRLKVVDKHAILSIRKGAYSLEV